MVLRGQLGYLLRRFLDPEPSLKETRAGFDGEFLFEALLKYLLGFCFSGDFLFWALLRYLLGINYFGPY